MGQCFYSFGALVVEDEFHNSADPGWAWLPTHAIEAIKMYKQSGGEAEQEDAHRGKKQQKAKSARKKKKTAAAATSAEMPEESQP